MEDDGLFRTQVDDFREGVAGPKGGANFQPFGEGKKKNNGRSFGIVLERHGTERGKEHEAVNVKATLAERAKGLEGNGGQTKGNGEQSDPF
jgi:hypothetical protein